MHNYLASATVSVAPDIVYNRISNVSVNQLEHHKKSPGPQERPPFPDSVQHYLAQFTFARYLYALTTAKSPLRCSMVRCSVQYKTLPPRVVWKKKIQHYACHRNSIRG